MSERKIVNKQLIANIKYLMRRNHESVNELSSQLDDLDPSSIRKYLNGERIPDVEKITKIAIHYRVSKEMLLYSNLKNLFRNIDEGVEVEDVYTIFRTPYSQEEIKKEISKEPYKLLNQYFDSFNNGDYNDDLLDQAIEQFKVIYQKTNDIDALIWCVWYYVINEFFDSFYINEVDDEKDIIKKTNTHSLIDNDIYHTFTNDEKNSDFFENCSILRQSKWSDLVYYYLALRYLYGYGNSDFDIELNKEIAIGMLNQLAQIGNKYAKDYYEYSSLFISEDVIEDQE